MKKQMSLFVWATMVFGMAPVWAATNSGMRAASSADLTGAPNVRTRANVNYEKYETRTTTKTYTQKDNNNLYYETPAKKSAIYKDYSNNSNTAVRTTRSETTRRTATRKYYLAHPFFQPMGGKFGSVTDFAYNTNSYDFKINQTYGPTLSDTNSKWDMTQFSVKEDLSYGITDRFAILGMARFDSSTYKMDWALDTTPTDKMDDSGINLYGLGGQWRFLDNNEWIGTASAYYQRQVDVANTFILDLKAGYKINTSTIYGLARGWMVNFDGNSYGNGIENGENGLFIAYNVGDKSATYFEGGVGVFTVFDSDWTANLEMILGNYDWHNQGSIKGAIGWQPGDSFALNLYIKTSMYDSANDKNLDFYFKEPAEIGFENYTKIGTAKIDNTAEMSIGVQAILYF